MPTKLAQGLTRTCPLCRVAAPPALESQVADASVEHCGQHGGSPSVPNGKNMSPLSPSMTGLPARLPDDFGQLSYSRQYDHLFATMPLDVKKPVPKPNPVAQQASARLTSYLLLG